MFLYLQDGNDNNDNPELRFQASLIWPTIQSFLNRLLNIYGTRTIFFTATFTIAFAIDYYSNSIIPFNTSFALFMLIPYGPFWNLAEHNSDPQTVQNETNHIAGVADTPDTTPERPEDQNTTL
jgi:hypothetical protein